MPNSPSLKSELSENVINRIFSWENSLQDALKYLHLGEYFIGLENADSTQISYDIGSQKCHINIAHNTKQGLIEAALIAFHQVFASGRDGPGFASNFDQEIRSVRERMKAYVLEQLLWTKEKYDNTLNTLKETRDSLTAHYDGSAANFSQPSPGIKTFAMRGALLNSEEHNDFLLLTRKMAEFVRELLFNDLPAS